MTTSLPQLGLVRRYLASQNWQSRRLEITSLDAYQHPLSSRIRIVLPRDPETPDSAIRVRQAVETLASLSQSSFDHMCSLIKGIGFDVIDAALPTSKAFRDSIRMRTAETFIRFSRKLLTATAVAELKTLSVTDPIESGARYADECKFGHTFRGSFGFHIMSQIGPNLLPPLSGDDSLVPPERKIVSRLHHGLRSIASSTPLQDIDFLVRDQVLGLDAAGYDAAARLVERANTHEISFSFKYSPEWKLADRKSDDLVVITSAAVPLLKESAKYLRKKDVKTTDTTIVGRIVKLFSKNIPTDLIHPGGREIAVYWQSLEFGDVTVRVRLSPTNYLDAIFAHEEGRQVEIAGALEPIKGAFRMTDVSNFQVREAMGEEDND